MIVSLPEHLKISGWKLVFPLLLFNSIDIFGERITCSNSPSDIEHDRLSEKPQIYVIILELVLMDFTCLLSHTINTKIISNKTSLVDTKCF